jgi:3-oxoacyl-[acyl-carrier protein] reductase
LILKDQVALVTGGCQGIGRACSLELAAEGAFVCVGDVNVEKMEAVIREIVAAGGQGMSLELNVSSSESVENGIKRILEKSGRLDILVNNAGITRDGLAMRLSDEDWQKVLDVNLGGAFYCCREALLPMVKARYGRIINITSVVAQAGNPGQINYISSKAGLIGLTKALAKEVAARKITVNAVAPGFIDTDMTRVLPASVREKMMEITPVGRMGEPAEVAHAVKFLASPASGYITGHVLNVNGGMYM